MCKFWPIFFNGIWLYDTQNTFYLIVRGLKNAFLMPLTPLLYRYLTVLWQSSSGSREELGILVVRWKWLFWCKIYFRTYIIIIKVKSTQKNNKKLTYSLSFFCFFFSLCLFWFQIFDLISFFFFKCPFPYLLFHDPQLLCEFLISF